ncbi:T9SS type A sorting domain-containing protein [Flavobacterium sp.]|uniref:T9SS type A sorting domain-containing protein n=1 Tax=Flavobacterium sp. TaxID=239 RepID=UPI0040489886
MKKLYTLLLIAVSTLSFGQIFSDDFNYPDADLLTANGWTAHSGSGTQAIDVGASNGLIYADYSGITGFTGAVEGNAAMLDNNGEDVNKSFTADVTTGSLYYTFLLNVSSATAGYFSHLGKGTNYAARIFVKPSVTGKFNIGISNSGTASFATTPTDFDLNTTYLVIVRYDVSTSGNASIWVVSSGIPATEIAAGTPEHTTSGSGQATIGGVYLRQYSATQNMTVDGVRVYSTWFGATPCDLTLAAETTTCDATTFSLDGYTVTIPFTGGNTAAYTLNASSGTISGDDPSTTASGNIIITGASEGTNITLTITGGCTLSRTITAPECKPVNTLPVSEPFNYTAGTTLNTSQMWTNTSTAADEITAVSGNLSYTGITPTGNSVSFAGTGSDTRLPFTETTSGELYASFLVSVTDLTGISTTGQTYFATLSDLSNTFTVARIYIKTDGTEYQFGISPTTSTAEIVWSSNAPYALGTTQYLVLKYDFTTNELVLVENPTIGGTGTAAATVTPTVAITSLANFILRQDSATTTPAMTIDELTIDTTTNFTLSSTSFDNINGLTMYPNPVSGGTLNLTSTANAAMTVQIFDLLGKEVLKSNVVNNTVNVAKLTAGVYVVKITEEGKTATRKLVVK